MTFGENWNATGPCQMYTFVLLSLLSMPCPGTNTKERRALIIYSHSPSFPRAPTSAFCVLSIKKIQSFWQHSHFWYLAKPLSLHLLFFVSAFSTVSLLIFLIIYLKWQDTSSNWTQHLAFLVYWDSSASEKSISFKVTENKVSLWISLLKPSSALNIVINFILTIFKI